MSITEMKASEELSNCFLNWGVSVGIIEKSDDAYFDGMSGKEVTKKFAVAECRSRWLGEKAVKQLFPGCKVEQKPYRYYWDIAVTADTEMHIEVKLREDGYDLEYFKTNNPYINASKNETVYNDPNGYLLTITNDLYAILHYGGDYGIKKPYYAPQQTYGDNTPVQGDKVEYPMDKALKIESIKL